MSENKFIRHLQGKDTAKSVLEIRNQDTPTSFANMPEGTSNANDVYSDHRGDAAGVLKGTDNWKLNGANLVFTQNPKGNGLDYINSFMVAGAALWVNASYTFTSPKTFGPYTKYVLKLCGDNLSTFSSDTVDFTLLVKLGPVTIASKNFTVTTQAFTFCKEFEIDFEEGNATAVKAATNDKLTVQLLCSDPDAQATIYNGMTIFTVLQRRVDSETVMSDTLTLDEIEHDLTTHIANKNNPHEVTKAQVGLGNCDNTSDLDKPVSTAQQTALDGKVNKSGGDTMSGRYILEYGSRFSFISNTNDRFDVLASGSDEFTVVRWYNNSYSRSVLFKANTAGAALYPAADSAHTLGLGGRRWQRIYVKEICGDSLGSYILTTPQKSGVIATMSDVELAANSGRMITDEGVWYAKMDPNSTVPSYAEVEGRNYADFTQTDQDNNPIIVIYTYTSGAWDNGTTVVPPAEYDGYVPVTAKIWDIADQTGQQGGRILWNHQSKEFTPYPLIVSFSNQIISDCVFTGTNTITMPVNYSLAQITNVGFVVNRQGWQDIYDTTWAASLTIELSDDKSIYFVDATADTTITIDYSGISVTPGNAKTFEIHISCGATLPTITWVGIDSWLVDSEPSPVETSKTSIFVVRVQQRTTDVSPTVVANYGGAY